MIGNSTFSDSIRINLKVESFILTEANHAAPAQSSGNNNSTDDGSSDDGASSLTPGTYLYIKVPVIYVYNPINKFFGFLVLRIIYC